MIQQTWVQLPKAAGATLGRYGKRLTPWATRSNTGNSLQEHCRTIVIARGPALAVRVIFLVVVPRLIAPAANTA
jgi:hypothetical protein